MPGQWLWQISHVDYPIPTTSYPPSFINLSHKCGTYKSSLPCDCKNRCPWMFKSYAKYRNILTQNMLSFNIKSLIWVYKEKMLPSDRVLRGGLKVDTRFYHLKLPSPNYKVDIFDLVIFSMPKPIENIFGNLYSLTWKFKVYQPRRHAVSLIGLA